ncbi:MAG TPA: hypothetical protein VNK23_11925 [Candidatus Dormibacteraeota bacterium]|nr:hypothetical protein [Candidatus Dormibacteraeota bacterium]
MHPNFQIRRAALAATGAKRRLKTASLLVILVSLLSAAAHAQNSPTQPIGRVQGLDVSVDGGTAASVATADEIPSINISNGSVVTVHSGKARLTLLRGGEVDVCGPAKFTMLTSGNDITLALNFGRLHVQLPANASLRIFSPTVIATPIDINGGSRDVTIGLDMNDSLCVLATSGAIQLEHQFTGEKLIVPQAGEFYLNGGTLVPVAGKPGSCGCTPMETHAPPQAPARIPEFARAAGAHPTVSEVPPTSTRAAEARSDSPAIQEPVQPGAVFVIPVYSNDSRPIAAPHDDSPGEAPSVGEPLHGDVTPALAFMASAPPPPAEAEPEMMLLVTEARESPDWEFDGHVDAPEFAAAMQHALGEAPAAAARPAAGKPKAKQQREKHGFWASLKGLFFGKVEADDSSEAGVH